MTNQALIVWDSDEPPPKNNGIVFCWSGYVETESVHSLLLYVETHAEQLRSKYLAWIHDLGESNINGKRLVDHLALRSGFSYWWMTLLAQSDSCIGGKTSINLGDKKNLIGNFYPPADIYIDTAFLATLPEADILSGIGEMLHYYYYAASPLFEKVIAESQQILADRRLLIAYIRESLQIKKGVIEIDEFDKGERNKFNYGHTFGHALESLTDYAIKHGQAVIVGMDVANYVSLNMNLMSKKTFNYMHKMLSVNYPICNW